jgi:hypothetical protein
MTHAEVAKLWDDIRRSSPTPKTASGGWASSNYSTSPMLSGSMYMPSSISWNASPQQVTEKAEGAKRLVSRSGVRWHSSPRAPQQQDGAMRNFADGLIVAIEALSSQIDELQRWQRVQTVLLILILVVVYAPYVALLWDRLA